MQSLLLNCKLFILDIYAPSFSQSSYAAYKQQMKYSLKNNILLSRSWSPMAQARIPEQLQVWAECYLRQGMETKVSVVAAPVANEGQCWDIITKIILPVSASQFWKPLTIFCSVSEGSLCFGCFLSIKLSGHVQR